MSKNGQPHESEFRNIKPCKFWGSLKAKIVGVYDDGNGECWYMLESGDGTRRPVKFRYRPTYAVPSSSHSLDRNRS
jgi:hypothetical protein